MKILHTADIHLTAYGDDRWRTLERIIEVGKTERFHFFRISGDFLDKGLGYENSRDKR